MSHQHYFVCPRCGQQWFTLERDPACEHADCRAEIARLTAEVDRLQSALGSRGAHEEPLELDRSYVRIRHKLHAYGALDTKPGGSDRFEKTEAAVDAVLAAALRGVGTPQEKEPK